MEQFLPRARDEMRANLREMGMPDSLFAAMEAVPPKLVRLLHANGRRSSGSPVSLRHTLPRARPRRAQYGIDEQQYVRRSARVLPRCASRAAAPTASVACCNQELLERR